MFKVRFSITYLEIKMVAEGADKKYKAIGFIILGVIFILIIIAVILLPLHKRLPTSKNYDAEDQRRHQNHLESLIIFKKLNISGYTNLYQNNYTMHTTLE